MRTATIAAPSGPAPQLAAYEASGSWPWISARPAVNITISIHADVPCDPRFPIAASPLWDLIDLMQANISSARATCSAEKRRDACLAGPILIPEKPRRMRALTTVVGWTPHLAAILEGEKSNCGSLSASAKTVEWLSWNEQPGRRRIRRRGECFVFMFLYTVPSYFFQVWQLNFENRPTGNVSLSFLATQARAIASGRLSPLP